MTAARPLNEVKAELFKGLAHPLRIRILELLAADREIGVAQLLAATGLEPSHLSQHLRVLRGYGLVTSQRRGSQVYYSLSYASVGDLLTVARTLLGDVLAARRDEALLADAPQS